MKLTVILTGILLIFHDAASDEIVCTINTKRAIHRVSDKFLSISIDPAVLLTGLNLSEKSLLLARHLSPAYIRVAGPSTQFVKYALNDDRFRKYSSEGTANVEVTPSMWFGINQWLALADLTPVFGINDAETTNAVWNPKPTLPMLELSDKLNVTCLWQLGFDCSNKTEMQYKGDLMLLRHLLDAIPSKKDSWKVVASDISRCISKDNTEAIRKTLENLEGVVEAVMWEPIESNEYVFPEKDAMSKLMSFPNKASVEVWTTAPRPSHPVSFATAILWMKQLSDAATMGYDVIFRQPRLHEMFSESPAYWTSLLYKTLMGRSVLDVRTIGLASGIHVYAHCTKNQDDFSKRGAMSILVINNSTDDQTVQVRLGTTHTTHIKSIEVQSYVLTAPYEASPQMYLNDVKLTTDVFQGNQTVFTPRLRRAKFSKHLTLNVSSKSISFFVLPGARVPVCINDENELSQLLEDIEHDQTLPIFEEPIELEPRISTTQPTLRQMQRAIERELATDERHYNEHAGKQNYNYDHNKDRTTRRPQPERKNNDIKDYYTEKTRDIKDYYADKKDYYTEKARDRTTNNKRTEMQKPIDLELTSTEVRKILADRARARAAAKHIMFTDEELEELMKKASEKFLDKSNSNDKLRKKFKRQVDQMHNPLRTRDRVIPFREILHRNEAAPSGSSRITVLKTNRGNKRNTTPRTSRIGKGTRSDSSDTLSMRLEAINEEIAQARAVMRERSTSRASERSNKRPPRIGSRTNASDRKSSSTIRTRHNTPTTPTSQLHHATQDNPPLRSHGGIHNQQESNLASGLHLNNNPNHPALSQQSRLHLNNNPNHPGLSQQSNLPSGLHLNNNPNHPGLSQQNNLASGLHSNNNHNLHGLSQSHAHEIAHLPNVHQQHNELGHLLHPQVSDIHHSLFPQHLNDEHQITHSQATHNQHLTPSQHTDINNLLHPLQTNGHLPTQLSHHESPVRDPLHQLSHHEPAHAPMHQLTHHEPIADLLHSGTHNTQHRIIRNSDDGTSTPISRPGQIPVTIKYEQSPQPQKRDINMKLLALETGQLPDKNQFKSKFHDKQMLKATMRKPDETSDELLRSLEETIEDMPFSKLPQGNVFAGLANSEQVDSVENREADQNIHPFSIKHKPLLPNLFAKSSKPLIQPPAIKTLPRFELKLLPVQPLHQPHGEVKLPKFEMRNDRKKDVELQDSLQFLTGGGGFDSIEDYDWDSLPAIHEYINRKSNHGKPKQTRVGDVNNFYKPGAKSFYDLKSQALSQTKKDDFDYSNMLKDNDYGEIDSDEKPLRFKRDTNDVKKDDIKMKWKTLKEARLNTLARLKAKRHKEPKEPKEISILSRNKKPKAKALDLSNQILEIDDEDPFGKQSFHFVIGDPEKAMKHKIDDRQKEKQFAFLKSRLAKKKKLEQKKKSASKESQDTKLEQTTIVNNEEEQHRIEKRSSEINNGIFKRYKPVIIKKKIWKPSDITSFKDKEMFLTNCIRRAPIDDSEIFKRYFVTHQKFKRNTDQDADVPENSIDSFVNDIIKESDISYGIKDNADYVSEQKNMNSDEDTKVVENNEKKVDSKENSTNVKDIINSARKMSLNEEIIADNQDKMKDDNNNKIGDTKFVKFINKNDVVKDSETNDSNSQEDSKSEEILQVQNCSFSEKVANTTKHKVTSDTVEENGFLSTIKGFFKTICQKIGSMFSYV